MRAVDFDPVEAQSRRAFRRRDKFFPHTRQTCVIEGVRRHFIRGVRHGRRRLGLPAAGLMGVNLRAALPRRAARTFAPGMRQLDRQRDRRIGADRVDDTRQRRLVRIGIEA